MSNGEMLKELRLLAESDKVPTASALRLVMSAMAEVHERTEEIVKTQECYSDELEVSRKQYTEERAEQSRLINSLAEKIDVLAGKVDGMDSKIDGVSADVKSVTADVKGNLAYKIGNFVKEHPKIVAVVATIAVVVSNLWFITTFRRSVLLLLRFPAEVIDLLAPLP